MKKLHELAEGDLVSETSQGAGWWQANDGKWYSPEQHPDYRPPPTSPAPPYVALPVHPDGWWQANDGRWYSPEQHPDYGLPAPGTQPVEARAEQPSTKKPFFRRPLALVAVVALIVALMGLLQLNQSSGKSTNAAPPSPAAAAQSGSTSMSALVSAWVNYYNQSQADVPPTNVSSACNCEMKYLTSDEFPKEYAGQDATAWSRSALASKLASEAQQGTGLPDMSYAESYCGVDANSGAGNSGFGSS